MTHASFIFQVVDDIPIVEEATQFYDCLILGAWGAELKLFLTPVARERLLALLQQGHNCRDQDCPCYEHGYEQAQETVGDWHRPPGY